MKKNNNKIVFYPFSEESEQFAPPPIAATRAVPLWYKKQPGSFNEPQVLAMGDSGSTIKRCMPIFDSMTAGYLILAPCDIYVDARDPEKLVYSVPNALGKIRSVIFSVHSPDQYREYPIDSSVYHKDLLRIHPLWSMKTSKGHSSLILQPQHPDKTPLFAFSGIVDTDTFLTDGHFSFLVEKDFNGIIKQGTPLVQAIPFRRESWESEIATSKEMDEIKDKQRLVLRSTLINGYKNKFRSKKEYK
jgi:hypothetical protein